MPTYDYFCEANQRTLEARHGMDRTVTTWGEPCERGKTNPGETPRNAKVVKLIIGGFPISGQVDTEACRPEACDAPPDPCCGKGACDPH